MPGPDPTGRDGRRTWTLGTPTDEMPQSGKGRKGEQMDDRVLDETETSPDVVGMRAAFKYVSEHPRLDGVVLQTVGVKGHDGFLIARLVS